MDFQSLAVGAADSQKYGEAVAGVGQVFRIETCFTVTVNLAREPYKQ